MFGNLGNMASLLKNAPEMIRQAQEMQSRMQEMRENLGKLRVEAASGGGMVRVQASGDQRILGVQVEDSVLEDREMLEDLLVAAVNQALDKAREAAAAEMQNVTGSMDLPGLDEALSKLGLGDSAGSE